MTENTNREQIMGMITLSLGPIENMMNVKLRDLLVGLLAKGTSIPVPALNQFVYRSPSLATVLGAPAFPKRRFVSSRAIHGIVLARSLPESFHRLWSRFICWIQFWMIAPIFCITIDITEKTFGVRYPSLIRLAAIWAYNRNLVLSEFCCDARAIANGAFS